jgi:uncharacterized membrane protein
MNGTALLWTAHLPPLLIAVMAGGLVAALWWFRLHLRQRLTPQQAWWAWWPKAALGLLLVLALLDPALRHERREPVHGTLAVLVDTSSSMDVNDGGKESRLTRARRLVSAIRGRVPSGVTVQALGFDTRLRGPLPAAVPEAGGPVRPGDPGMVLQSAATDPTLTGCVAVVALTDGGDEPFAIATPPPVPLSIIGIGASDDEAAKHWNNLAVAVVRAPAATEVHLGFTVEVELAAQAVDRAFADHLDRVGVVLELAEGVTWKEVARTEVGLANGRAQVSFTQQADQAGLRRYRVGVPVLPGEVSALDNRRDFTVDIREQSLHLLFFTRELGAEFKALRQELARDAGLTFTALFRTLAGRAGGDRYTLQGDRLEGDAALEQGFPTAPEALARYGCVVVGSFPAAQWRSEEMAALVAYVERGGAAIFLGGEQSFAGGGYGATPLAELMPFALPTGGALARGAFAVAVPALAASHPAVAGVQAELSTSGGAVESLNLVGMTKPGATVLLETAVDGRARPVATIQPYGRGKVAAIATNTLWRLARPGVEGGSAYGRFWRQLVRQAAEAGDQGHLVRVQWDHDRYRPGDIALATVAVTAVGGAPTRLSATIAEPGADARPVALEAAPGPGGDRRARLALGERGDYRFHLVVYQDDRVADTYDRTLVVAPNLGEGNRLTVDHAMLRAAAQAAGGAYAPEAQAEQVLSRLGSDLAGKPILGETSLVNGNPWFLAAVLALLVAEWIIRRRMNLI